MNGSPRLSQHRPFNKGFLTAPPDAMRMVLEEKPPPRGLSFDAYLARLEQRRALTEDQAAYFQSGGYAMFDRHFLAWAEVEGYSCDILVNDDLHWHPEALDGYKCMVCVGHDEVRTHQSASCL